MARVRMKGRVCSAYVGRKRGTRKESHTRDRSEEEGTIASWVFRGEERRVPRERVPEGVARTTKGVFTKRFALRTQRTERLAAQKTRYPFPFVSAVGRESEPPKHRLIVFSQTLGRGSKRAY